MSHHCCASGSCGRQLLMDARSRPSKMTAAGRLDAPFSLRWASPLARRSACSASPTPSWSKGAQIRTVAVATKSRGAVDVPRQRSQQRRHPDPGRGPGRRGGSSGDVRRDHDAGRRSGDDPDLHRSDLSGDRSGPVRKRSWPLPGRVQERIDRRRQVVGNGRSLPEFAAAAMAHGVRSTLSLPMLSGERSSGH